MAGMMNHVAHEWDMFAKNNFNKIHLSNVRIFFKSLGCHYNDV